MAAVSSFGWSKIPNQDIGSRECYLALLKRMKWRWKPSFPGLLKWHIHTPAQQMARWEPVINCRNPPPQKQIQNKFVFVNHIFRKAALLSEKLNLKTRTRYKTVTVNKLQLLQWDPVIVKVAENHLNSSNIFCVTSHARWSFSEIKCAC